MKCDCDETRISFTDAKGNGRAAPVRIRCAKHPVPRRKPEAVKPRLLLTVQA